MILAVRVGKSSLHALVSVFFNVVYNILKVGRTASILRDASDVSEFQFPLQSQIKFPLKFFWRYSISTTVTVYSRFGVV
jgi:hypothetical protein